MPLTLNVGLSKKIGQPNYGSYGASCHIEVELDRGLLEHDLQGFHCQVRNAYVACRQAVQEELSRHEEASRRQNGRNSSHGIETGVVDGSATITLQPHDIIRRATARQVRAITALAKRHHLAIAKLLRQRFYVDDAASLSITEASQLIKELNSLSCGEQVAA